MSTDGQGTKCRRNIAENFNRLSRAQERYRQTTDGRAIAYSERSLKTSRLVQCSFLIRMLYKDMYRTNFLLLTFIIFTLLAHIAYVIILFCVIGTALFTFLCIHLYIVGFAFCQSPIQVLLID